jgi:uncharacterized membrane protein
MNQAQIHLALNHFPIAGAYLSFAFLVWGLLRKKDDIKFAAISLIIISGIAVLPMYFTGEGAEKVVEHKPLVTEEVIHPHEEAAEAAVVVYSVAALLAISWIIMKRKNKGPDAIVYKSLIGLMAITSVLIGRTAHLGGQIRHDEIRSGAVLPVEVKFERSEPPKN